MVVWCTQNVHRYCSSFMWHQPCNNQTVLQVYHFGDIKNALYMLKRGGRGGRERWREAQRERERSYSHSFRITCDKKRSESARERRIALNKSDHHDRHRCFACLHSGLFPHPGHCVAASLLHGGPARPKQCRWAESERTGTRNHCGCGACELLSLQ